MRPIPMPEILRQSRALPERVVGGYWRAEQDVTLDQVPSGYNLLYLFHAIPEGQSGALRFVGRQPPEALRAELAPLRERMPLVLTVGGANHALDFTHRAVSEEFMRSIAVLHDQLGGIGGVDFNTYEGTPANHEEYIWIADALKDTYGGDFLITTPPAPWRDEDRLVCQAMAQANVLDLCSPQFYGGPGLAELRSIERYVGQWAALVGPGRLGLGLGISSSGAPDYMTVEQCTQAWTTVESQGLRGAYLWSLSADRDLGWAFSSQTAARIVAG